MNTTRPPIPRTLALATSALLLLTACGGGGGGGGGGSTTPPALLIPKNVKVVVSGGKLVVSWGAVTGASAYKLYVSSSGAVTATGKLFGEFTTTTATHPGQPIDKRHYFAVTAVVGGKESGSSEEVVAMAKGGDEYFQDLWHLKNTGQNSGTVGQDINVEAAWKAGYTGKGVRMVVLDGDLDIRHEDLRNNVVPGKSYNYIDKSSNPTTTKPDFNHGTFIGGICARDCQQRYRRAWRRSRGRAHRLQRRDHR